MATCAICQSPATEPFAQQQGFNYVRCCGCRFVFLDPMPAPESLSAIYNEEDTLIRPDFYPKAASRMRRAMMKAVRLWPYYVGRETLDVGCGGGFMAAAMQRLGARAAGIDISEQSIAFASAQYPRVKFYRESFDSFLSRGLTFKFLYSSEVIEHIGEVQGYMRFLASVARPGALLYMTTPDVEHETVPHDVTQWDMLSPPRHVQLFCETNLRSLFAQHGFDIIKRFHKNAPTLQVLARKHG